MRPPLHSIPLNSVQIRPRVMILTINPGCWDKLTQEAYQKGWILLEIENETPVRAFQNEKQQN